MAALTTMTWSPQSTWGAQIGLCLPRSSVATWVATRPSTRPSASTTCQARVMSEGFGVKVGTRTALEILRGKDNFSPRAPNRAIGTPESGRRQRRYPGRRDRASRRRRSSVLLDPELSPIVDMVLQRTARRRIRGGQRRRPGRLPPDRSTDGFETRRRPRATTRSPTSRRRTSPGSRPSSPTRTRTGATTPTRSRSSRPPSSSTIPRHPTSASSTRPRTTGRTRAATGASTGRSAWCRRGRRS